MVYREYRKRKLIISLLNKLRQDNNNLYDIISFYITAYLTATKVFGNIRLKSVS
jgi:hypothetical protein